MKRYVVMLILLVLVLAPYATVKAGEETGETYEIATETYAQENININYPKISNLHDGNKQKLINELLINKAFDYREVVGLSVRTNYEIKWQSANLLSVQYKSYRYVKGAAHPINVLSIININIGTGSEIALRDIVVIDEDFVAKVRAGEFVAVSPRVKENVSFTDEALIREFIEAGNFYFARDSLGIRATVPHVAGDYVIFEVKYWDIAEKIQGENPVWREFFP